MDTTGNTKTDIRPYLHLYLRCEVVYTLSGIIHKLIGIEGDTAYIFGGTGRRHVVSIKYIKPILRPLSSITEAEGVSLVKLLDPSVSDDKIKENIGYALEAIKADGIGAIQFYDVPALNVFQSSRFLLSKHFDLFGLIESGLAIDATTINQPSSL